MAKAELKEITTENSPTRALAQYIAGLSYKDIPEEVIAHIKFCLIDSLGCALFGSTLPWGRSFGRLRSSWAKEKALSSGAIAPRFRAPVRPWPTVP